MSDEANRERAASACMEAAALFEAGLLDEARKQLLKALYASDKLRGKPNLLRKTLERI